MCDTIYKKTLNGFVFGKNSDRSANEPNLSLFIPHQIHEEKTLKCTYIEIEQVDETNALLLVKPSWIWGGEMGMNEHNVMIGNEAVFTKTKHKNEERLIGMDYLRLALERSSSAVEAIEVICNLLKQYGQGGNCGFDKAFFYDNSYLIADSNEAYILETSGKQWAYHKIENYGAISNRLTLEDTSTSSQEVSSFRKKHSDFLFTHFSGSKCRLSSSLSQIQNEEFDSYLDMIHLLQSHHEDDEDKLLMKGSLQSLCMHQSTLGDHTTSSMVVEKRNDEWMIYLTSSSTPCISLYKPVFIGLNGSVQFVDENDAFSYWLREEKQKRAILAQRDLYHQYKESILSAQEKIDELVQLYQVSSKSKKDKLQLMSQSMQIERDLEESYHLNTRDYLTLSTSKIWMKKNQKLGLKVFERKLKDRLS